MKSLKFLFASISIISILTGCGTHPTFTNMTIQQPENIVQIQSDSGLKNFYKFMVTNKFNYFDKNRDQFMSFEEFKKSFTLDADINKIKEVFLAIDTNKDNKLSYKESSTNKNFVGVSKEEIRTSIRDYFDTVDKDKNQNLSIDEFISGTGGDKVTEEFTRLFFLSDKNFDNKLVFSEAEDLIYAVDKATWKHHPYLPYPDPGTENK